MYNASNRPGKCVISGKPILNIGGIKDTIGKKSLHMDGVHTDIGTISRHLIPAYRRALDEVSLDPGITPKSLRKMITQKLQDADYVRDTLVSETRDNVFSIMSGDLITGKRDSARAVRDLRDFLLKGINVGSFANEDDGENGLELRRALGCMIDDVRTMKFCDSLLRAVENQETEKESVEVVDAGSGPIPIFGILAALKSDKVRATCIELNPRSAKMAKKIVENLGLEDRVKIVCADAKKYEHDREIDVLVSETMFSGLTNGEQMVQILAHLRSQVDESGEVIPRSVTVEAGIAEYGTGKVKELNVPLSEVYKYEVGEDWTCVEFDIDISGLEAEKPYELILASKVEFGDGESLEGYESVITRPTRVGLVGFVLPEDSPDDSLYVCYNPGDQDHDIIMHTFKKE